MERGKSSKSECECECECAYVRVNVYVCVYVCTCLRVCISCVVLPIVAIALLRPFRREAGRCDVDLSREA